MLFVNQNKIENNEVGGLLWSQLHIC